MDKIIPVVLAGGTGTRLWPLSRKSYPKQFSNLLGSKTLFQQTAERLTSSEEITFAPHITLTHSDFRFIVGEQLQNIGIEPGDILIEPEVKNTAPAILAASLFAYSKNAESILLVAPSDHFIPDNLKFHKTIASGLDHVKSGKMVMFGVSPSRPETGYGYLELSKDRLDNVGSANIKRFIEKPDKKNAEKMLGAEKYLWNAGIFLFKSSDMIKAFEIFAPETLLLTKEAVRSPKSDLNFLRINQIPWSQIESISIDYAILEKANNLVGVPFKGKWSDLGEWDAVWSQTKENKDGIARFGHAHAVDCSNTLLRSESVGQQIVGLGLNNIIAIAMQDAVLIANKDRAQDVKKVVDHLKASEISQAEIFPKDYRPWGWYESLAISNGFQVKRICVKPGAALSLQSHKHRSEHWIVVEGTARVTLNSEVKSIQEGQSVYVPLGMIHRLENPGEKLMILIEVQIGSYLGEDDIVRYEDIYDRQIEI